MKRFYVPIVLLFTAILTAQSPEDVLLRIPFVRQKPDFCGEACVEMYLQKLGHGIDQDEVFNQSGIDPVLGRGCYTPDLLWSLKYIGFKDLGAVWHRIDPRRAGQQLTDIWRELHSDLRRQIPSIVCMRYRDIPRATEHFRLVLGYDAKNDEVIYHEPALDDGAYKRMKRTQFFNLWPLKYDQRSWTVIRIRLQPGKIRKIKRRKGFSSADYMQHIRKLKKKLPHSHFRILVERPFVVVSDAPLEKVHLHTGRTIRRTVKRLREMYFRRDPQKIIDVWLLDGKQSYRKYAREVFGHSPKTPFGYYSRQEKAMVMNIRTGGGTLAHEIVHPFIEANFPRCPTWFDEGLASLYEHSGERDGLLYGNVNWRLPVLQRAIRSEQARSLKNLTATTRYQFYNVRSGFNYSQARYLCYYLQERGLLRKFYHQFVANVDRDPTGYKTLQKVLGEDDMQAFDQKLQRFALQLRYSGG